MFDKFGYDSELIFDVFVFLKNVSKVELKFSING